MEENTQHQTEGKSAAERLAESMEARGTSEESSAPAPAQKAKEGINKYILVGGVLLVILIFGGVYQAFFVPEAAKPIVTGEERFITITVHENTWTFDPEFIEAEQGDKLILTVINEDAYDHGFAIDAFGISQRMPAKSTIQVEFVVTKAGDFPYYCSVSCGSGIVDGEERGHFDQIGLLNVRSAVSETVDYEEPAAMTAEALREEARRSAIHADAESKARELGFDVDALTFAIDEDMSAWSAHVAETPEDVHAETLSILEGKEFHIAYYTDAAGDAVLWLFIDAVGGEIIAHKE